MKFNAYALNKTNTKCLYDKTDFLFVCIVYYQNVR